MNPILIVAVIGLITGYRWCIQDSNKIPAMLLLNFSGFLLGWALVDMGVF